MRGGQPLPLESAILWERACPRKAGNAGRQDPRAVTNPLIKQASLESCRQAELAFRGQARSYTGNSMSLAALRVA